jgi:hypothetical protein
MPALPPVAAVQEYGRSIVLGDRVPVHSGIQAGERVVGDGAILLKGR